MNLTASKRFMAWVTGSGKTDSVTSISPERDDVRILPPLRLVRRLLFSNLTRWIFLLNLLGLVLLVVGILNFGQPRDSLVEARVDSLLSQGEIIASAIAAQATVETNVLTLDPTQLLELQTGESAFLVGEEEGLHFPINPEQVAPVLEHLILPTGTRARIYDMDGTLILDSARLYSRGRVLRTPLPDLQNWRPAWLHDLWHDFKIWLFLNRDLPLYGESPDTPIYPEVLEALGGSSSSNTWRTSHGDTIVSVAVPVQRFRAVLGVLLLSTEAGTIDQIIRDDRLVILGTFLVASCVALFLSVFLAGTISLPLRKLTAATERVRLGSGAHHEIPDLSSRHDDIGYLSVSLRAMTSALYGRIEAIERFAADVSHELKNPLTSLRSAVETLPRALSDEQRRRLLSVIEHDVKRLDRLISDISAASRLDAELAREEASLIDLNSFFSDLSESYIARSVSDSDSMIDIRVRADVPEGVRLYIHGYEGRLGQVLSNLVDNARSFVDCSSGVIDVVLRRDDKRALIEVTDNGPGIPPENLERIFDRFYTDRTHEERFGENSGLGLSITRQIVEAHGGSITAENIEGGARFSVYFPLAVTP